MSEGDSAQKIMACVRSVAENAVMVSKVQDENTLALESIIYIANNFLMQEKMSESQHQQASIPSPIDGP
ncbi:hypothetical protein [Citrobacter sp. Cpo091]|uniref:hypothetical protein n=1 Tax=Citrobacter sp. Cpo091 TaxID=2985140 RepID=UPI0025749959|nr:hypothetical protein [Citrobacter sp. Cpo091]MDM2835731.1 hypothetical protein [Citrobacter sp. Cpo091]